MVYLQLLHRIGNDMKSLLREVLLITDENFKPIDRLSVKLRDDTCMRDVFNAVNPIHTMFFQTFLTEDRE